MLLASLEAFLCQLRHGEEARVARRRRGAEPDRACGGRAAHAFELPARRPGVAAELPDRPARTPRMMRSPQMQQLRQRVIASYHLGPLDKAETRAYIEHRLNHVGWNDDPHIEPDCFDLIHTVTGGIPRRINTLCNRLLLAAYLGEQHTVRPSDVQAIAREIREEIGPEAALTRSRSSACVPRAMSHPRRQRDAPQAFRSSRSADRSA